MTDPGPTIAVEGPRASVHTLVFAVRDKLPMFVIYDHPSDFPDHYVARLWLTLPEEKATYFTIRCTDLERIRDELRAAGMVCMGRTEGDDPQIIEVWI